MCMTDKSCEDSVFIGISRTALGGNVHSRLPLPPPKFAALTGVKEFAARLTRPGKSYSEINSITDCALGVKSR